MIEGFVYHGLQFETMLIVAFAGAVLAWIAAMYVPHLFNRQFIGAWGITLASSLVLPVNLFLLLLLLSSRYAPDALSREIDRWSANLAHGMDVQTANWHYQRACGTYEAVRALQNGDLTTAPPPSPGGADLRLTQAVSFQAMANLYAEATVADFLRSHPFLATLFPGDLRPGQALIASRIRSSLGLDGGTPRHTATLTAGEAVAFGADALKSGVQPSSGLRSPFWRGITQLRVEMAAVFLVLQAMVLAGNGWAAYRLIRVDVGFQPLRSA